jgi:hypothetical protein
MTSRRDFFKFTGAVAAASVSPGGDGGPARDRQHGQGGHAAAAGAAERPPLQPGGDAQRLDAAVAHEGRGEGVSPGRRAGGARDRPRHEGAPVGLQRAEPGPDDRGGRGRPRAHLRHQPPARAHHDPLARPAPAQRHGRRRRPDPAAHRAGQDLRLRIRRAPPRHLHVPPARRRDDADGDGHDGLLGDASEKPAPADRDRRPRLLLPA